MLSADKEIVFFCNAKFASKRNQIVVYFNLKLRCQSVLLAQQDLVFGSHYSDSVFTPNVQQVSIIKCAKKNLRLVTRLLLNNPFILK